MGELFQRDKSTISRHIKNIFSEGELVRDSVVANFATTAADMLFSLQVMQDFGVNLVCVEDGIDSSKDAGKLMISVLSAVAEIERENIRFQTMEGRIQNAREGRRNGGFAPYGYQLLDGKLIINEKEAEAIRIIYDQYVHTDIGANGRGWTHKSRMPVCRRDSLADTVTDGGDVPYIQKQHGGADWPYL